MSRSTALLALVLVAAGCGSAPQENTSEGTVAGVAFTQPTAFYNVKGVIILRDELAVLISDDPSACDHLTYDSDQERPYLKLADGTHAPSLWMKMLDKADGLANMRGIGDDLSADFDPGAPAGEVCAGESCQARWLRASRGTVDILHTADPGSTGAYAAGEYYLTFDGQQISGTFRAVPCKALKVEGCGGCASSGAGLAPGLALLALAALRRRR